MTGQRTEIAPVLPSSTQAVAAFVAAPAMSSSGDALIPALIKTYRASVFLGERLVLWEVSGTQGDGTIAALLAATDLLEQVPDGIDAAVYLDTPMTASVARGERAHHSPGPREFDTKALMSALERQIHRLEARIDTALVRKSTAMATAHKAVNATRASFSVVRTLDAG